jgi:hypothetical protein
VRRWVVQGFSSIVTLRSNPSLEKVGRREGAVERTVIIIGNKRRRFGFYDDRGDDKRLNRGQVEKFDDQLTSAVSFRNGDGYVQGSRSSLATTILAGATEKAEFLQQLHP